MGKKDKDRDYQDFMDVIDARDNQEKNLTKNLRKANPRENWLAGKTKNADAEDN